MTDEAARVGYHNVSVAQVASSAGVSSATFYELFPDKESCMIAAYRAAILRFFEPLSELAASRELPQVVTAALSQLLDAVQQQPNAARLLFIEALSAGGRLDAERSAVAQEIARRTRAVIGGHPGGTVGARLDIPTVALVGGVRNTVSRHLHNHAEDRLPAISADLARWALSYATIAATARWSSSEHALLPAGRQRVLAVPPGAPIQRLPRLPRGRHHLPHTFVARSQRTRLIYGTAEVMLAKGYANATVADIVTAAGVSRAVFYEHFKDKEHAFLAAQQHPTHYVLDVCATAYFAGDEWPDRVWRYIQALLALIAESPALSHLRLVECYAAGPEAIRRAEDITRSFTLFIEEGYRYSSRAAYLPRLCPQAITGALYEIVQRHVASGRYDRLQRQLPRLTYVVLAPYTGPEQAISLVRDLCSRHLKAQHA
ncbi:MAG TPA: helix-turn-helix domain-containing protein [Solirubrobacteraceae bacterium]|nr:helix-turn-helix domain-containing protein [Solirubrobacteraceae bacterium]